MRFFPRCALLLAVIMLFAAGCIPLPRGHVYPSDTPTITLTPSATTQWFPSTATPTLRVVNLPSPTPNQHPGLGSVVFTDDFGAGSTWQMVSNSNGSIAFGKNELTIAISNPKASLLSLQQTLILTDFYLEITASPDLCRGDDAYGLLLRAATNQDFYRFLVSCNGMLRLERLNGGTVTILQDWTPSGQVPPGSPLVIRLGVWAVGNSLRFFVNDKYQFSVNDKVFSAGGLGVYARSAGQTALTVSFSDLEIREVNYIFPSATPSIVPTPNPG